MSAFTVICLPLSPHSPVWLAISAATESRLLPSKSSSPPWMLEERWQKSIYKVRLELLISAQQFCSRKEKRMSFLLRLDSAALLLETRSSWCVRLGTLYKRRHQKALIWHSNVSKSRSLVTVSMFLPSSKVAQQLSTDEHFLHFLFFLET